MYGILPAGTKLHRPRPWSVLPYVTVGALLTYTSGLAVPGDKMVVERVV